MKLTMWRVVVFLNTHKALIVSGEKSPSTFLIATKKIDRGKLWSIFFFTITFIFSFLRSFAENHA